MKSLLLVAALLWPIPANAEDPKLPNGYTCEDVRRAVEELGRVKALAIAIEKRATWRQIQQARKCLK